AEMGTRGLDRPRLRDTWGPPNARWGTAKIPPDGARLRLDDLSLIAHARPRARERSWGRRSACSRPARWHLTTIWCWPSSYTFNGVRFAAARDPIPHCATIRLWVFPKRAAPARRPRNR